MLFSGFLGSWSTECDSVVDVELAPLLVSLEGYDALSFGASFDLSLLSIFHTGLELID